MMKSICTEIQEKLLDYIDDALNADDRLAVKAHLSECSECRREYDAHLGLTAGLANFVKPSLPKEKIETTAAIMSSAQQRAVAFMPEPAWERVLPIALPIVLGIAVFVLFALEQLGYINLGTSMPQIPDIPNMPNIAIPDEQVFLTLLDRGGKFMMQPWVIVGAIIVAFLEAGFFLFDLGD